MNLRIKNWHKAYCFRYNIENFMLSEREKVPTSTEGEEEFPRFLKEFKPQINLLLHKFISSEVDRIKAKWPYSAGLLPLLAQFVERDGKRVRPSLAILGYRAFHGSLDERIFLPALSTEFMHASFIIHDDLYDDMSGADGTRRGEKVLHLNYEEQFLKRNAGEDSNWEPRLFARHAAVASAHVILAIGARTIHQSDFPPEVKAKALTYYWNTVEETWLGQGMDILSKGKRIVDVGTEEIIMTEMSRASVYTIEFPLHLGAILAGADDKSLQLLSVYGRSVGLAFEIYDDILGIFGKESEIGKLQADLAEGKRTLLIQKALENGNQEQKEKLLSILRDRNPRSSRLDLARIIINQTGALDHTTKLVQDLVEKAKTALNELNIGEAEKESLGKLAQFVINRRK